MSFQIILYNNTIEDNRLDKTKYLNQILTIDGTLKEETSITNPSILIQVSTDDNIFEANYLYIPTFNRYYFINDIKSVRNQLWRLDCSVDVLMSFKETIMNQKCVIERQEYDFDNLIIDNEIPLESNKTIEYQEFENDYFIINNPVGEWNEETQEFEEAITYVISYVGGNV